ncbi:arsenite methyltransferase-like [Dendronephthya gigantea]|uniref:arsenite methyltransferase-like n=1 Tax=Dendronephthya gigantea TaxID=151771 RepID=UPI00106ABD69|nr:arsenite methyltransferase-like [Dendronephthya gigantea]
MADAIKESVKEYYGKILQTNNDVKTNACIQAPGKVPKQVKEALELCHDEVLSRYYGCGLVFPTAVQGISVLDFGSGAGRDCFILSKLVGKDGFVTGVDMTEEQLKVAKKHIPYHMEKFGYDKPNVVFKLGYIENLKAAGVEDKSCDLIISNCVINLSPDKPSVFKEAFRVLKDGGELYFSDIYADRELPQNIKDHKELWGECLAGALYWKSFVDLAKEIGFSGPYLVTSRDLAVGNEELSKVLGDSKFVSATYRLFKSNKTPDNNSSCSVKYKGTMSESSDTFKFDHEHSFDSNFQAVSYDIFGVLKNSRYSKHLEFNDADSTCTAPCASANSADPFKLASAGAERPPCCKKAKACC